MLFVLFSLKSDTMSKVFGQMTFKSLFQHELFCDFFVQFFFEYMFIQTFTSMVYAYHFANNRSHEKCLLSEDL